MFCEDLFSAAQSISQNCEQIYTIFALLGLNYLENSDNGLKSNNDGYNIPFGRFVLKGTPSTAEDRFIFPQR